MTLEVDRNRFADPDHVYRRLIEAHRGLSAEASAALDARLVLVLANHIGDAAVLDEAIRLAVATLPPAPAEQGDSRRE